HPSEVFCGNGSLWLSGDPERDTPSRKAKHLKMVLADASTEQNNSTWIDEFRGTADFLKNGTLAERAELFTAYFLARVIRRARGFILSQTPDFDEAVGDRCMVNMAVPVAHAQESSIAKSFDRCLRRA